MKRDTNKNKRRVAVCDCETDPFEHGVFVKPFVWQYYDGYERASFWGPNCTERFVDFISEKKVILYAHNGGKFDYFFLLKYMKKQEIRVINGRISECRVGECILRDSYNIIPVPLAAYKKTVFDYSKMHFSVREKHKSEIMKYLDDDCNDLYDLVSVFSKRFGNKLTLATAAMDVLKSTIGPKFDTMNEFNDSIYREYYYGGRCEVFEGGEITGDFDIVDIKSAYPYAMTFEHPDPCWLSFRIAEGPVTAGGMFFAHIRAVSYGALPYRDENGALQFPNDDIVREFKTTSWEINAGIKTGTLHSIEYISCRTPEQYRDFKNYVDMFFAEKQNAEKSGDLVNRLLAKLFLNAAYGKFAIDPTKFETWNVCDYGDEPDPRIREECEPEPWKLKFSSPEDGVDFFSIPTADIPRYINVSVAASITGFVRAYLWENICNSTRPLYCDTDSITCEKFGGTISDELGAWENEGISTATYVAGKKLYAMWTGEGEPNFDYKNLKEAKDLGWKTASKGAQLLPHEIIEISLDSDAVITWESFAPTYSLTRGVKFVDRRIKNTVKIMKKKA